MKAIDTNILIRYLIADDPVQTKIVERFFQKCHVEGERIFLSVPVICETAWVLAARYKASRPLVVSSIEQVLSHGLFVVEWETLLKQCLQLYRQGPAGLADYVIGALAKEAGCTETLTFDRGLRNAPGFSLLT